MLHTLSESHSHSLRWKVFSRAGSSQKCSGSNRIWGERGGQNKDECRGATGSTKKKSGGLVAPWEKERNPNPLTVLQQRQSISYSAGVSLTHTRFSSDVTSAVWNLSLNSGVYVPPCAESYPSRSRCRPFGAGGCTAAAEGGAQGAEQSFCWRCRKLHRKNADCCKGLNLFTLFLQCTHNYRCKGSREWQ